MYQESRIKTNTDSEVQLLVQATNSKLITYNLQLTTQNARHQS